MSTSDFRNAIRRHGLEFDEIDDRTWRTRRSTEDVDFSITVHSPQDQVFLAQSRMTRWPAVPSIEASDVLNDALTTLGRFVGTASLIVNDGHLMLKSDREGGAATLSGVLGAVNDVATAWPYLQRRIVDRSNAVGLQLPLELPDRG